MQPTNNSQDQFNRQTFRKLMPSEKSVASERLVQIDTWQKEYRTKLEIRKSELSSYKEQLKTEENDLSETLKVIGNLPTPSSPDHMRAKDLSMQVDVSRERILSYEQELESFEEWFRHLSTAKSYCEELHRERNNLLTIHETLEQENQRLTSQVNIKESEIKAMSDQIALKRSRDDLFLKSKISFTTAWLFYILGLVACGLILSLEFKRDSSQQSKLSEQLVPIVLALSSCGFGVSISRMAKSYDQQLQNFSDRVEMLALINKMDSESALEAYQKMFEKHLMDGREDKSFISKIFVNFFNKSSSKGDENN
jgi:chromosome segregation ATPase